MKRTYKCETENTFLKYLFLFNKKLKISSVQTVSYKDKEFWSSHLYNFIQALNPASPVNPRFFLTPDMHSGWNTEGSQACRWWRTPRYSTHHHTAFSLTSVMSLVLLKPNSQGMSKLFTYLGSATHKPIWLTPNKAYMSLLLWYPMISKRGLIALDMYLSTKK